MPPRGRATPAMIWSYANGVADSAVDPQSVAAFLSACLNQMDPSEQQECVAQIAELLDQCYPNGLSSSDQYSAGPTPNQMARAMRANGGRDRRAAMGGAASRRYRDSSSFFEKFPGAAKITIMG